MGAGSSTANVSIHLYNYLLYQLKEKFGVFLPHKMVNSNIMTNGAVLRAGAHY